MLLWTYRCRPLGCLRFSLAAKALHEDGEVLPEPWTLLPEEGRLCDAAGVNGAEGDASGAMEALVEHIGGHHPRLL